MVYLVKINLGFQQSSGIGLYWQNHLLNLRWDDFLGCIIFSASGALQLRW